MSETASTASVDRVWAGLRSMAVVLDRFGSQLVTDAKPNGDWTALLAEKDARRDARSGLPARRRAYSATDPALGLRFLIEFGRDPRFSQDVTRAMVNYASELKDVRDAIAHNNGISEADAARALDTISRLMAALGVVTGTTPGLERAEAPAADLGVRVTEPEAVPRPAEARPRARPAEASRSDAPSHQRPVAQTPNAVRPPTKPRRAEQGATGEAQVYARAEASRARAQAAIKAADDAVEASARAVVVVGAAYKALGEVRRSGGTAAERNRWRREIALAKKERARQYARLKAATKVRNRAVRDFRSELKKLLRSKRLSGAPTAQELQRASRAMGEGRFPRWIELGKVVDRIKT